ncbi:potassium channel family protein [Archaeoglobus veneficus]|nr:potassium channel family protein [Archaeoglobus veneficus]
MRRTVKDLLIEIKDTSEVIVDLAYSAILFDNEDIAEEVLDLENRMNSLLKQIRIVSILAARRVDEAESVSTVLQIANASQKISNAAGDIAILVLRGFQLPKDMVKIALLKSEETVAKATVSEVSELAGKTLGEARLHTLTGMKVIAIRRGYEWIFDPDRDTKIYKGDTLFAKGDISGVPKFFKFVTGEERKIDETEPELEVEDLDRAVDILIEMKNLSELAVDLSYLSLLYYNDEIAQEVGYIEEKVDNMKYELQHWVLESSKHFKGEELKPLVALLDIAYASETIADSAKEIAQIVIEKMEIHPIFKEAMREADEIITIVEVTRQSSLDGKTLGEAKVETNTGMHVVAIKRGHRWITHPTASTKIQSGDLLIVKGTREGEQLLRRLCAAKAQKVR